MGQSGTAKGATAQARLGHLLAAGLGLQGLGRTLPEDRALDLGETWNQHSPPRVRGFQDVGSSPPCLAMGS